MMEVNNLDEESFYLLMSAGELSSNGIPMEHDEEGVSANIIDFSEGEGTMPDSQFNYGDCETTKSCFGHPDDCISSEVN